VSRGSGADLNKSYANYFEACGIAVVAMEGIEHSGRSKVPSEFIYSFIKKKFLEHAAVDAIYILGSPLDALGIVATLEQDLGVPVVQPTAARVWEIQRRLHVR
jgi:maleate cis-trans isomerase